MRFGCTIVPTVRFAVGWLSVWSRQRTPEPHLLREVLGESQPKPKFLVHLTTAAVLQEMIACVSTPTVATADCLLFLRVNNKAGFQRYLKRLSRSTQLYHAEEKEE